jgi:Na+-transporting methylmalonyl-CoA/oxaloacetate decarboxylase gamma subunit
MTIDWGFAGRIGGIGFGMVFVVLITLAIAIWLVGLAVRRIGNNENKTNDTKKKT